MARGLCSMHYKRWWKYGDPLIVERPLGLSLNERLDRFTVPLVGGCHAWIGQMGDHRRATLEVGGKTLTVARLLWEAANGPIPEGLHVLHRCDHPWCVNLLHLWIGTRHDNMGDAAAKGRMNRNWKRLSPQIAATIRAQRAAGTTVRALADTHGVTRQTIHNILSGRAWATPDAGWQGTASL